MFVCQIKNHILPRNKIVNFYKHFADHSVICEIYFDIHKMFKIFLIELTIHLVIFFTILEVYFKTPILNLEEYNETHLGKAPLGKRVVLIVIDNLSANSIYNASNDSYSEGVNFIK